MVLQGRGRSGKQKQPVEGGGSSEQGVVVEFVRIATQVCGCVQGLVGVQGEKGSVG